MNLGSVRLCMYMMCLLIFEEKVEILDQNTSSLNPDQKVDDPILGSRQKYWANVTYEKSIPLNQTNQTIPNSKDT